MREEEKKTGSNVQNNAVLFIRFASLSLPSPRRRKWQGRKCYASVEFSLGQQEEKIKRREEGRERRGSGN